MTEAELLSQITAVGSLLWSLMQYWTSVSIGILIGSYFVANRLNLIFLGLFVLIYIFFSIQIVVLMHLQVQSIVAIGMDLNNMDASGIVLSTAAINVLENSPVLNETLARPVGRALMFGTMFLLTIIYPFYCRLNFRKLIMYKTCWMTCQTLRPFRPRRYNGDRSAGEPIMISQ